MVGHTTSRGIMEFLVLLPSTVLMKEEETFQGKDGLTRFLIITPIRFLSIDN